MALATAQDLIDSSLRLLGVIDQEGTPTTNQRAQGLDALNALIDSFVIDHLLNYVYTDEAITLAAASATWGTGGTINSTRPTRVLAARRVSGSYEYPIPVLPMDDYRALFDKSVTGTIAGIAYDPTMTTAFGTLYAVSGVGGIKVTSLKPWTQYSALSTSLGLPPGYVRALRHTLAIELSPEYVVEASPISIEIAKNLRTDLGRQNAQVYKIVQPLCAGYGYDINSDGVR